MRSVKLFKVKLNRFIVKFSIIILLIIFVIKLINLQQTNNKKREELKNINKQIETVVKENLYLKQQIQSNLTDEYKEKYARENLDMVKTGERIFYDTTKE